MTNARRVLVTGGAGFIGSHVVDRLLDRGDEVHVVDDLFAGEPDHVPDADDATLTETHLRSTELETVVDRWDPTHAVHLAAIHYIPYCNENPEEAFEVNVMGTRAVFDALRDADSLECVVNTSSAAVYPARDHPHSETDELGPMDIYGRSKLVGEDLARLFHADTGVPTTSARLFNVYGPNETNDHLIPAILEQLEDGSRTVDLGNLTPARDFIHVTDVARAIDRLTRYDEGYRAYNVGTGEEHTVREVVEHVSKALGESVEVAQDEDRVRESDRPHLQADIDRITDELDWRPRVTFTDGLRDLIERRGIA